MADGFKVEFSGLKEIDENLARLGAVAGEKVMRSSLFIAMKPIRDRAVAGLSAIPRGSGALAKATRIVYLRGGSRSSGKVASPTRFVVAVAPKTKDRVAIALANLHYKRKKPVRGVIWGHLLEWGHQIGNRTTGRLPKSRRVVHSGLGRVRGLRIFTKAFEAGSLQAVTIFRREIEKRVAAALRRQAKRKAS